MAITYTTNWTTKTVKGRTVCYCKVSAQTSDTDIPTKAFPDAIDTTRPYSVIIYVSEDLTAASSSYIDLHGGWAATSVLTGGTSLTQTSAVEVFAGTTDVDAGGTFAFNVIPAVNPTGVANTTTFPATAVVAPFPYMFCNVDAAALQDDAYIEFWVVQ